VLTLCFTFKKVLYNYLFDYNKPPNAKTLHFELASALWTVLLKDKYSRIDQWITFITNTYKKSITKDIWQQFFEFTVSIKHDFSNYELDGAWPLVCDEFIDFCGKK